MSNNCAIIYITCGHYRYLYRKKILEREVEMSKFPVTVCIIAKNEERYIEECLKHLQKYGFEIIVTDTGSTDKTVEIAKKYADKVVEFEWINDFSAARNYCASFATNNWIIALDCDEYMMDMDLRLLRIYMQKCTRMTGTIRLKNLSLNSDGTQGYGTDDVIRMYNKNYYYFKNAIHEQLVNKDPSKEEDLLQCFLMPCEVVHHGYALTREEMIVKQKRNLDMILKELEKTPDDSYLNFQAGQSFSIIGVYDEAVMHYERGLSNHPGIDRIFVQVMIVSLAKTYHQLDRDEDALNLLEKYEKDVKTAKFMFAYAGVLLEMKQYLKSLMMYLRTVTCIDVDTLGEDLLNCYEHIVELYNSMGSPEMGEPFKNKIEELKKERDRVTQGA